MSSPDSKQPTMSSPDSKQPTMSSPDSKQPTMSSSDSNHHNTTALSLLADLHSFLATTSLTPTSHALITAKWDLLTTTYHLAACYVSAHKAALGGSWPANKNPPPPTPNLETTKLGKKYAKAATALIAANRDFSKHALHVEALGRQVLAVPNGKDQEWERSLLLWQIEREKPTIEQLDKKCETIKARVMKLLGERSAEKQAAEDKADWERHDPVLKDFLNVHVKMEEVEGEVKGFLGEGVGEEGMGKWRVWPDGKGCVAECLVAHVHVQ